MTDMVSIETVRRRNRSASRKGRGGTGGFRQIAAGTVIAAAALCFGSGAAADGGARIALGEIRLPPKGWVTCVEAGDPGCQFGAVEMSSGHWQDLNDAQAVNERWTYKADRKEEWRSPRTATGDCEDAALAKLAFLKDRGWPEEALRIAVGKRDGKHHAALLVRTNLCDMILDNEGPVQCATKSRFRAEKINVGPFWRDARDTSGGRTLF